MPATAIFCNNPATTDVKASKGPNNRFSGDVYLTLLHNDKANTIATVMFTPCGRTNWHTHEGGQLIRVISGNGWVCDRGGTPKRLKTGDTVWCPPGTEHWHGADDDSGMVHFVHAHGAVEWLEPVSDEDYGKKSG
jgi:quercetin dioxygenase-like cupin family protein